VPRNTSGRRGHGRRSSRSRAQTSTQELALAKALKPYEKFATKTSAAGAKAACKKIFCTSTGRSGVTRAPKHALNLFGSDSSASDGKTTHVERLCKHSKETSLAKDIPKSSALKGIFE
jgi:hypothetical protein